jgi:hypothetical protein
MVRCRHSLLAFCWAESHVPDDKRLFDLSALQKKNRLPNREELRSSTSASRVQLDHIAIGQRMVSADMLSVEPGFAPHPRVL